MTFAMNFEYTAFLGDDFPLTGKFLADLEMPAELPPSRRQAVEMAARAERAWFQLLNDGEVIHPDIRQEDLVDLFVKLPPGLFEVDAYVSHAGSICFDWDESPGNTLSLILKPNKIVGYAAYFDGEKVCASEDFGLRLSSNFDRVIERWVLRERRTCEAN
jgi:hypothetical protein